MFAELMKPGAHGSRGRKAESDPFLSVAVIGRGGEQISRIQAESGCKIQIASGKEFLISQVSVW